MVPLPEGSTRRCSARSASVAENVVLAPGQCFSLSQHATGFLRFNVAQSTDERIFKVLADAMRG